MANKEVNGENPEVQETGEKKSKKLLIVILLVALLLLGGGGFGVY